MTLLLTLARSADAEAVHGAIDALAEAVLEAPAVELAARLRGEPDAPDRVRLAIELAEMVLGTMAAPGDLGRRSTGSRSM